MTLEIISDKNKKWINAAGTAGYAPTKNFLNKFPDIGLFVTNPISYLPRIPANERCLLPFDGGFLVHSGFPCPGFRNILKNYQIKWENALLPICVSLLSDTPDNIEKIIRTVENIENIVAIELSLNNSLKFDVLQNLIKASVGELPIILSVPYEMVYMDWIEDLFQPEILAVSIQAPRGTISSGQKLTKGRLYGSAMLPLTLGAINQLSYLETAIIAGVGCLTAEGIQNIYNAGAQYFQPHELIWRDYS